LFRLAAVRRFAFRTVSQIMVNYRGGPISHGSAGKVYGGDRLPWVGDNFAKLSSLDWQIHVYGEAAADLKALADGRQMPLHVFAWHSAMERAGLKRDSAYLVRPDGYVALAEPQASAAALGAFLDEKNIKSLN
jgi:hypothetical protein